MTRLGRYFKAPSKRATRQWFKVELLHEFGEQFVSGNSGLGEQCGTLAMTIRYLIDQGHDESAVRNRLKLIRERRRHNSEDEVEIPE